MPFGQLVIGPPGAGKSTYCAGLAQFLGAAGRRVAVVNLDPANDAPPYQAALNVQELVSLEAVMNQLHLGPNGGLLYCMEYLEQNLDWLRERLQPLEDEGCYFLFDCPGQVELFTQHGSLKATVEALTGAWHYRLVAVHLTDAHLCSDVSKYLAAALAALSAMLWLALPHLNLLSKVDLVESYGQLPFDLDFFTEANGLEHIVQHIPDDAFNRRFRKLTRGLAEVVDDFGLLHFLPVAIEDRDSVAAVVAAADKATGYVFAAEAGVCPYPVPPEMAYSAGLPPGASSRELAQRAQEQYMSDAPVTEHGWQSDPGG